jgi:hypothetical protein
LNLDVARAVLGFNLSREAAKRGRGLGVRGYAGPALFDYVHEEGSKSTRPTNLAANASVKHFDSRNR